MESIQASIIGAMMKANAISCVIPPIPLIKALSDVLKLVTRMFPDSLPIKISTLRDLKDLTNC